MEIKGIRTLLYFLRPYPWALPTMVTFGVFASLSEGLSIGLLVPFVEIFMTGETAESPGILLAVLNRFAEALPTDGRLIWLGTAICTLVVLKAVIQFANLSLSAWVKTRVTKRLRDSLQDQLLRVAYGFFVRRDQGQLLNTFDRETERTSHALGFLAELVIRGSTMVVFTIILLLMSWQMTLVVAAVVGTASLFIRYLVRTNRRLGQGLVGANVKLSERMLHTMRSLRAIHVFGQEDAERERFGAATEGVRRKALRTELVWSLVHPTVEVLYVPIFLSAMLVALRFEIGVGVLLAYLLLVYRLQPHIRVFDQVRLQMAAIAGGVESVRELLADHDKPYIVNGHLPFTGLRERIAFERVSFRYQGAEGDPAALDDVSFELRRGLVTAIVGPSGAGKSTVIGLLYRFDDPQMGRVLVDGRPLPEFDVVSWRARMAAAGHDAELMTGSIRDNIAYGRPDADMDAIRAAAKQADAAGFIEALPDAYDSLIGDQGVRMSSGQRQRIGLARALLREPEILVLDEATSALDSVSESVIQATLASLKGRATIILIAHRLSSVLDADHVIVMDRGRVVEEGVPRTLMAARGPFANLYDQQRRAAQG